MKLFSSDRNQQNIEFFGVLLNEAAVLICDIVVMFQNRLCGNTHVSVPFKLPYGFY